jgi:hypothetical protein
LRTVARLFNTSSESGLASRLRRWRDSAPSLRNCGGAAPPTINPVRRNRPASTRWRKPQCDVLIDLAGACEFWHDAASSLRARAVNEGSEYQPFIRTGYHGDKLYLDLCDRPWRAVEISPHSCK